MKRLICLGLVGASLLIPTFGETKSEVQSEKEYFINVQSEEKIPYQESAKRFKEKLENEEEKRVLSYAYIGGDYYVYVTTERKGFGDGELMMLVHFKDGEGYSQYWGGDGTPKISDTISQIVINKLKDNDNPNICVFRTNAEYKKATLHEIKGGHWVSGLGTILMNTTTNEYIGDEAYRYVFEDAFLSNLNDENTYLESKTMTQEEIPSSEAAESYKKEIEKSGGGTVLEYIYMGKEHYAYLVESGTGLEKKESVRMMSFKENEPRLAFQSGIPSPNINNSIDRISVGKLKDNENINICIFRKGGTYRQVECFELLSDKTVNRLANLLMDTETNQFIGNEEYRYVLDASFPYDYIAE